MDKNAILRRQQAAFAGHTGDETLARQLIHDENASVRATAFSALHRLEALTEDDLSIALTDDDPTVRRRACALAITFTEINLVAMLQDVDNSVIEQAAWALGEHGEHAGKAAVAALSQIVREHEDALCREAAVAALGAIGDEDGLPAILHATRDKPAIRRRATLALAPFEGPEVDEALERAQSDRDWQVRQAAEDLTEDEDG